MTDITLNPVGSGYNLSVINNNFQILENLINSEVLHLTGGNNVMAQDLDLNSNAILNARQAQSESEYTTLQQVIDLIAASQPVDNQGVEIPVYAVFPVQQARQFGNSVLVEFDTPATEHVLPTSLMVYLNGIRQRPFTDYNTLSSNVGKVTFSVPPKTGTDIDIMLYTPINTTGDGQFPEAPLDGKSYARNGGFWNALDAAEVAYDNTTSGFVATDVQAAIDEAATSGGGTSWVMSFVQTGELSSGDVWMADASAGNVTRNLPLSPTDDDEVMVRDYTDSAATNTITLGRNGQNIEGLAEDLVINIVGGWVRVKYDTTNGWRIVQSS